MQEYSSRWTFPSSGDLPKPRMEPRSPALQADSLPSEPSGKPLQALWLLVDSASESGGGGGGGVAKSCSTLATPRTVARQALQSMKISRQESWSGLPFPTPGDLPDPGIKPESPALVDGFFTTEPPGKSIWNVACVCVCVCVAYVC